MDVFTIDRLVMWPHPGAGHEVIRAWRGDEMDREAS